MSSPSTLIRRAKATKNRPEAKRLRAQAAKLRREKREVNAMFAEVDAGLKERFNSPTITEEALTIPSIDPELLTRLKKLAATRNSKPDFEIALRSLFFEGKAAGRMEQIFLADDAEKHQQERLKSVMEANAICVVSGFMAIVKHAERYAAGALPPTMTFTGYTVAKLYDALRDAGYTENGKDSGFRRRS